MKEKPFLTIGMATYDDFHGVYFSIQSLRMHHKEVMDEVEILIVDNNPQGQHGQECKNLAGWSNNVRYIPESKWVSTAVRDKIFQEAKGDFVMSIDCHVLFEEGLVTKGAEVVFSSNSGELRVGNDDKNRLSMDFPLLKARNSSVSTALVEGLI